MPDLTGERPKGAGGSLDLTALVICIICFAYYVCYQTDYFVYFLYPACVRFNIQVVLRLVGVKQGRYLHRQGCQQEVLTMTTDTNREVHASPPLGIVASVFVILFIGSIAAGLILTGGTSFLFLPRILRLPNCKTITPASLT